ncbi:MAG: glycosyltransferase family 4 protein, partial [Gimesia chilikensis]
LKDRPVLLSVGRLVPRKGLVPFVEHALPKVLQHHPNAVLTIVGQVPDQALLHGRNERSKIEAIARRVGLNSHILFCGRISEAMLSAAYSDANLLIFPVVETPGDVEGFGMVALEAAAFGLPTFGFSVDGLRDSVLHTSTGELFTPGDYDLMADAICKHLDRIDQTLYQQGCLQHAERHSWQAYGEQLRRAVRSMIRNDSSTSFEQR